MHRLSRLHPAHQREVRAIERLKSWDGDLDPDTVAGTIFHAFTVVFAEAIVRAAVQDDELVERWLNKSGVRPVRGRVLSVAVPGAAAHAVGRGRPGLVRAAAARRSWDEVALEALEKALDGLEERFGRDPAKWRWGRVHEVEFTHPFGAANPLFRRIFNRTVEAGGASETVTQNGYLPTEPFKGVWGPVYRMLADLGDPARSRWQLTTGQSGHPGSPHYDDMIEGWRTGQDEPRVPRGARGPRGRRRQAPAHRPD